MNAIGSTICHVPQLAAGFSSVLVAPVVHLAEKGIESVRDAFGSRFWFCCKWLHGLLHRVRLVELLLARS